MFADRWHEIENLYHGVRSKTPEERRADLESSWKPMSLRRQERLRKRLWQRNSVEIALNTLARQRVDFRRRARRHIESIDHTHARNFGDLGLRAEAPGGIRGKSLPGGSGMMYVRPIGSPPALAPTKKKISQPSEDQPTRLL